MRQLSGTEASYTSPRHQHAGLLIVGCTYEEGLLDKALLEAFEERVHFPLPTALQRRSLCAAAWWAAVPPAGEATPRPLPAELNQFSDSMAGVPLIPLLLRIEEFVGQLVLQETSASHTCSFEGVAGLEHVKRALSETVLWPRRFPHLYRSFSKTGAARGSIDLPTGLLLFGPPGKLGLFFAFSVNYRP
jgi:SpoVK/Ycf46/Vps4 family AAA+-type ATPase